MRRSAQFLTASEAATRLGVSAKALRLYERRGLVAPVRTAAGWRTYGPEQMARAAEIAALRALGLSLDQVERMVRGGPAVLATILAEHQATLDGRVCQLAGPAEKVRSLRAGLARGVPPDLLHLQGQDRIHGVDFTLPWPWGGERFALRDIGPLNYITGPLGSGKTRFAKALAASLPRAAFLGSERTFDDDAAVRLDADAVLKSRVDQVLTRLVEDGATISGALIALVVGIEAQGPAALVVDMVEQGLDQAAQEALMAQMRRRGPGARPLFLLTRSCVILDLAAVGASEAIILCPANHSPPTVVAPYPDAPGYDSVASCLALPEVRARTEGVIAWRPQAA